MHLSFMKNKLLTLFAAIGVIITILPFSLEAGMLGQWCLDENNSSDYRYRCGSFWQALNCQSYYDKYYERCLYQNKSCCNPSNKSSETPYEVASRATKVTESGLPSLRQGYADAVSELRDIGNSLRAAGVDSEQIARAMHANRRAIGEQFKALTPPDKLAEISARNLNKYGDNLGPSVDWLRSQGKSWDDIIESAGRIGGKYLGF